jgi:Ca2+/Na+ antiporter
VLLSAEANPSPIRMNISEILGSLGVTILLLAFVLNLMKLIRTDSLVYGLLNALGAAIACYASFIIPYFPFVILEGVWTVLSIVALVKTLSRLRQKGRQQPEQTD